MKKIAIIVSFILIASGCSMIQPKAKPVSVTTISERPPMYHPPLPMEYEHLSMDIADITRYIKEVLGIIKFYRDYDNDEETKNE